ncbi:unnamed protein product [Rotaria socialis]|uniref:Reverse transcriptase domain-containing protein n=1 Tax=Rotaria socialis TaxID=392032 RepID=A0A818AL14_9BILA|nr:unnamed protein product [Rotaria socialis]CAF4519909.1 unnamed protein product [Rotaria socialis]
MTKTNTYEELPNNICPLTEIFQKVVSLLNRLLKSNAIIKEQHKELHPHRDKLVLAHLYFIPKSRKPLTPLRPISSCINGPTACISSFLQFLLGPVFLKVAQQTTFTSGIDVVRALQKYRDSGRLKPTTLFVTFDVTDLYTMIPRQGAIDRLS